MVEAEDVFADEPARRRVHVSHEFPPEKSGARSQESEPWITPPNHPGRIESLVRRSSLRLAAVFSRLLTPDFLLLSLRRRLRLEPFVEVGLAHEFEIGPHLVMAQSAKLGANDLVSAGLGGHKVDGDFQARDQVLLQAQLADEKRMRDVLRAQNEL